MSGIRVRRTTEELLKDTHGNPVAMAIATIADELYIYLPKIVAALEAVSISIDRMNEGNKNE